MSKFSLLKSVKCTVEKSFLKFRELLILILLMLWHALWYAEIWKKLSQFSEFILFMNSKTCRNNFQVYDLVEGPKDYQQRLKTAADIRKDIEATFQTVSGANDILAKLLSDDKKAELAEEVCFVCLLYSHF